MNNRKPAGIRWPKIGVVGATKKYLNKEWHDFREYASGRWSHFLGYAVVWTPIFWLPWFLKKSWQTLTYTHLSRHLALLLTLLVVFRERDSLWAILSEPRWPRGLVEWLVVGCTAGTLYAFKIEVFEKRRAISDQELRFQQAVQMLSKELATFTRMQGTKQQVEESFDSCASRLLEIAALAFSLPGNPRVDAGLMVKDPESQFLKLVKWSRDAQYDPALKIRVSEDDTMEDVGPAGIAFAKKCLVYVPKRGGRGWPLGREEDVPSYWPLPPCRCWVRSRHEDFRTVICAPIGELGVLNFSTQERDPFVFRDFVIAQYFADMLGEAAALAEEKSPHGN